MAHGAGREASIILPNCAASDPMSTSSNRGISRSPALQSRHVCHCHTLAHALDTSHPSELQLRRYMLNTKPSPKVEKLTSELIRSHNRTTFGCLRAETPIARVLESMDINSRSSKILAQDLASAKVETRSRTSF
eukprot:1517760-Amphidinium_carterae.1